MNSLVFKKITDSGLALMLLSALLVFTALHQARAQERKGPHLPSRLPSGLPSGPCPSSCYPVRITDAEGRQILITRPFKRIISLYPAHSENLILLGAVDSLAAVSRGRLHLPEEGQSRTQADSLPRVSFRDDPERLLALKPDLVLIRPMISRAHPGLVERLRSQGVCVVSLQPSRASDLYGYWMKLGLLSGRAAEAERMIQGFRQELSEMEALVAGIPEEKRPKVYFEAIHSRMKTFAPGSIAIFALERAGGINIAADAFQVRSTNIAAYGKERILAKADLIDVYLAQKGRMNRVSVPDILNEPGFQVIKAVREGRVYLVDEALVSRPTPRLMEGIRLIHRLLYGKAKDHGPDGARPAADQGPAQEVPQ